MPEAGFTAPPAQGPVPEQGLQATPNRRHIEGIDEHTAASPPTSTSEETFDVSTGVPHAIASTTGRPNPSTRDG